MFLLSSYTFQATIHILYALIYRNNPLKMSMLEGLHFPCCLKLIPIS